MKFAPVKFDNIIDNNNLTSDSGRTHADVYDCLPHFFNSHADIICLDFTSITLDNREALDQLFFVAYGLAQELDKPFLFTPVRGAQNYLDKQMLQCERLVPMMAFDEYGELHWYGTSRKIRHVLNELFQQGTPISVKDAIRRWGQQPVSDLVKLSQQPGHHVTKRGDFIIPRLSRMDVLAFLQEDYQRVILDGLINHLALLRHDHFQIAENKIHTDSILLIERLLNDSTKSLEKLVVRLRQVTDRLEYDVIVCDSRLSECLPLLSDRLNCTVLVADVKAQQLAHVFGRPARPGASALVLESIVRTGRSVSAIADLVRSREYTIKGVHSLFGFRSIYYGNGFTCEPLFQLKANAWQNQDICPLCKLDYPLTNVARGDDRTSLERNECLSETTPYHFWLSAMESGCVHSASHDHVSEPFEGTVQRCFKDFIDSRMMVQNPAALGLVTEHLYCRLIHEKNVSRRNVRFILFKEGFAARTLAESLAYAFAGWIRLIGVNEDHVNQMQADPQTWSPELRSLSKELKSGDVLLVDDCINRGLTLNRFHLFFEITKISHVGTAVIVNRHENPAALPKIYSPVAEFYRASLDVWLKDVDCPMCRQNKVLAELLDLTLPPEVRTDILRSRNTLEIKTLIEIDR